MSDDIVSAAPPSGGITWADYQGKLIVVEPLSFETGVQTTFGVTDATKANVYVLNSPTDVEEHMDTLIFPKLLASQAKSQIGKKMVGRLGQGVAKPGQDPPWVFDPASEEDLQKVQDWLASRQGAGVTSAQAPF